MQAHWPEGNVLLKRGLCDPECGIPDFDALVEVTHFVKRSAIWCKGGVPAALG